MNKENLNCHVEPKRQLRAETSLLLHISSRDIAENAKLNHEIAEELRKYTPASLENKGSKFSSKLALNRKQMGLNKTVCLLTLFTLLPTLAQAETCTATPDCKSLGYTETSCPDGSGVKCPWNTALLYCGENGKKICADMGHPYTCTGANESPSGKACANKYYTTCTCSSGYGWKNEKCEKLLNGLHGDFYYCEGQVVGIKVPGQSFAIAMNDASSAMNWGKADSYCTGYRFCGTGTMGRLPTQNELLKIHDNITYLQEQLQKNGGQQFYSGKYWSSSVYQYDDTSYYFVNPVSGDTDDLWGGGNILLVRPVLAF